MAIRPSGFGDDQWPGDETPEPVTSAQWRVDRALLVVKVIGVVVFAVAPSAFGVNPSARWLGWAIAIGLAIYALRDLLAPVRLAADDQGVTVIHGYAGHLRLPWSEIERVRVDANRRGAFLEVDAGDSLHLFSRFDLGMQPEDAFETLEQIRTAAASQGSDS